MHTWIKWLLGLHLIFLFAIHPPAGAVENSYRRVVLLLWDTSQSMVMRKTGPTVNVQDLERLHQYVSDLLFHGISLPVREPDFQQCQESFLRNPKPLVDANTLLIAHRFHVVLEQPQGALFRPSQSNREEELWRYMPKASISKEAGYTQMETELVRPIVDAITHTEQAGYISQSVEEIFLVIVSDTLTDTTIPPANLPKEYLDFYYSRLEPELLNNRICTIGVQCHSQVDSIHRILINTYRISKQSVLPQTQSHTTPVSTSIPDSIDTPTPATTIAKIPYTLVFDLPSSGLGLSVRGDRVYSELFPVFVQDTPDAEVPLPSIHAELLDDQGNIVSQGNLVFDGSTSLPAKSYIDFASIQGDRWPVQARWNIVDSSGIAGIVPTDIQTIRIESTGPFLWILALIVLVGGLFVYFFRSTRRESDEFESIDDTGKQPGVLNQVRLIMTLEASYGSSQRLEFYLSPGEIYRCGESIQGQSWFDGVDCLPYHISLESGWLKKTRLIIEEPYMLDFEESSSTGERERIIIALSSEPERRTLLLKGRGNSESTEIQLEVQLVSSANE